MSVTIEDLEAFVACYKDDLSDCCEVTYRTIAKTAYYAMFHLAKECAASRNVTINDDRSKGGYHVELAYAFKALAGDYSDLSEKNKFRTIERMLFAQKARRSKACYELHKNFGLTEVEDSIKSMEKFREKIESLPL